MLVSFARLSDETLLLFNRAHWFAKKSIKMFRIFFEVCYKFNFMKQRRNVFKTNQHVFELVARLAYLLYNLRVVHLLRIFNWQISLVLQNFKVFKKKLISIKTAVWFVSRILLIDYFFNLIIYPRWISVITNNSFMWSEIMGYIKKRFGKITNFLVYTNVR